MKAAAGSFQDSSVRKADCSLTSRNGKLACLGYVVVEDHPWKQTGLAVLSSSFLVLVGRSGQTRAQFISLSRCS